MIAILIGLLIAISFPSNEGYDLTKLAVKVPSSNRIQPISRGVRGFMELVEESDIFIDRTQMINDIVNRHQYIAVLTNPSKWGKSVNLDMIRVFLQMNIDENGEVIVPRESSRAYQLFMNGEITWTNPPAKLRSPLAISDFKYTIDKYQGMFPVLYLDFRNITGITYEYLFETTKARIQSIFKDHGHLAGWLRKQITVNTTSEQKLSLEKDIEMFENYTKADQTVDEKMLEKSLHFLGTLIWRRYQKRVVVLIDDYDVPYRNVVYQDKLSRTDGDKIMKLYQDLFEYTLDHNSEFLQQAIITGTFHLGKGSRLTPFHKSLRYHIINNPYSSYYGFSQQDVDRLNEHLKIPFETAAQMKYWYAGYYLGKNFTRHTYSPMSVVSFVQSKLLKSYQRKRESRDLMHFFVRIKPLRPILEQLLNNQRVIISKTRLCFTTGDIMHMRHINENPNAPLEKKTTEIALAYLAATGYLSVNGVQYSSSFDQFNVFVRIPNKEILYDFSNRMETQYRAEFGPQIATVSTVAADFVDFYKKDTNASLSLERSITELIRDLPLFYTRSLETRSIPVADKNNTTVPIADQSNHNATVADENTSIVHPADEETGVEPVFEEDLSVATAANGRLVANKTLLYSLFNFVALRIRADHRLQCKVPKQKLKPFMTLSKGARYAIVALKLVTQTELYNNDTLDMAKSFTSIFAKFTGVRYIGIEITANKTVHVKGEFAYANQ